MFEKLNSSRMMRREKKKKKKRRGSRDTYALTSYPHLK
jgi:hypothetical protein